MTSFSELKQLWHDYPVVVFFCLLVGGGLGYALGVAHINYVAQARDYFKGEADRLSKAQNEAMGEVAALREKISSLTKNEELLRAEVSRSAAPRPDGEKKVLPSSPPQLSTAGRAQFRADSIKLTAKEAAVLRGGCSWNDCTTVTFVLENQAGLGFGAAFKVGGTSIGACVGNETKASGLPLVNDDAISRINSGPNPEGALRLFPAGSTIHGAIELDRCGEFLRANSATDFSLTLAIAQPTGILTVPISVPGVPVRWVGERLQLRSPAN